MKYQWHAEGRQASLKSRTAITGKTTKAEFFALNQQGQGIEEKVAA